MSYVVYNPTSRLISGAYQTQAAATTAAVADSALAADTVDRSLPDNFRPGVWFFNTDSEITPELPATDETIVSLRRATHKQLLRGLEANIGIGCVGCG